MDLTSLILPLLALLGCFQPSNHASIDAPNRYQKFDGEQGLYGPKDDVEILTVDNFLDAITNSPRAWLIEFYNSWCGFCQKFAPSWKEFATDVHGWSDVVRVAAVDCSNEKNNPLCRDYEIMGYPTLRYFPEEFHPDPEQKFYGFAISRGVSAEDHRKDLVKKIVSEQWEDKGKQFPQLLPLNKLEELFEGTKAQNGILIVHESSSLLGPEIALDLHKNIDNLVIRYAYTNNTDIVSKLPSSSFPGIYLIAPNNGEKKVLISDTDDRKGIVARIIEELKSKGVELVVDMAEAKSEGVKERKMEDHALMETVKKMGDVVFQLDLETALRYSLKREVGGVKEITGERLEALKNYLNLLLNYFPIGRNGKHLLQEIINLTESSDPVEGIKITKLVKEAEKEDKQVFSGPQRWLGCQGSTQQYRGYPCGLWKMFHYLTINVANDDFKSTNPRLALEAMHGYIKYFFGCADCSQHFQQMAAERNITKVNSLNESILWLWRAHNEVNNRLAGDASEDPVYPKIQFPSPANCPKCRHANDGDWDTTEVYNYLKNMYSQFNIRYLGADTKVIYLGLNNTRTGGLLELDVVIYILLYIAILVLIYVIIKVFLKRGYRRKMYRYKHDLLGKV